VIWPQVVLAGLGLTIILVGLDCPLTALEDWPAAAAARRGRLAPNAELSPSDTAGRAA
jgi:hypothetical protein